LFSAVVLRTTGPFSAPPFGGGRPAHPSGFLAVHRPPRRGGGREPSRWARSLPWLVKPRQTDR